MAGRYGNDRLNTWLLVSSLVLMLAGRFSGLVWLSFIGYLPLALFVFRFFSRNVTKRYDENYRLKKLCSYPEKFFKRLFGKIKKAGKYISESKTHRHWKCPGCRQKIKVPKGRGTIEITCPKCGEVFRKKS